MTDRRGADEAERELGEPGPAVRAAIAYHSVRGHVAKLAHAVAEGVDQVSAATPDLVALDVLTETSWALFDRADALIFGCPTFMGGVSAVFKAFAEASLRPWIDNLRWRNKVAGGFTHSQAMSGDKLHTLEYFTILAAQHGIIWVPLDLHAGRGSGAGAITDLKRLGPGWG
jgi:NAD(P)H dehydrogenase (quinone)